jgi:hypothetical protein
MQSFEQAWVMSNEYHRVTPTVRVAIQTRAVNIYTYVEDFVPDGGTKRWQIRSGTIQAHGNAAEREPWEAHPRLKAKARAEALYYSLKKEEAGLVLVYADLAHAEATKELS